MLGSCVLMYHDLYDSALFKDSMFDNYSVAFNDFKSQVDMIMSSGKKVSSVADFIKSRKLEHNVMLTFDDGHASNYEKATDYLSEVSASADFFVNTATVGKEGYVSWNDLRDMITAGMSVQSHSHDHVYLTTYSDTELMYQLEKSKKIIEDNLGEEVFILSAPGGRINNKIRDVAESIGYRYICDSVPKAWDESVNYIPRVPVYKNISPVTFNKIIEIDSFHYFKQLFKYHSKNVLKGLFGNKKYEEFRKTLLKLN